MKSAHATAAHINPQTVASSHFLASFFIHRFVSSLIVPPICILLCFLYFLLFLLHGILIANLSYSIQNRLYLLLSYVLDAGIIHYNLGLSEFISCYFHIVHLISLAHLVYMYSPDNFFNVCPIYFP